MVLYICNKCNKNFTRKQSYEIHINRKKTCITENNINKIINLEDKTKNLEEDNNKLEDSNQQLEDSNQQLEINNNKLENKNKQLEDSNKELLLKVKELEKENSIKQNKIILLEEDNKRINELYNNLLDKCIKNNSNNIITTNTVNNNNNTINITLKNFGNENYTKLTNEEQIRILKSNKQCVSNLIKCLHINDRLPEYKNICIKNLRGKGGYLYEGNKWLHCNFENLLIILFKNKINDLEKILNSNEGLISFNNNYIQNLIENYTDDMDTFIKNNKDNIINMLYNNTKNYKI